MTNTGVKRKRALLLASTTAKVRIGYATCDGGGGNDASPILL